MPGSSSGAFCRVAGRAALLLRCPRRAWPLTAPQPLRRVPDLLRGSVRPAVPRVRDVDRTVARHRIEIGGGRRLDRQALHAVGAAGPTWPEIRPNGADRRLRDVRHGLEPRGRGAGRDLVPERGRRAAEPRSGDARTELRHDPKGRPYYWIEEGQNDWEPHDRSDYQAVRDGYVSVTPLHPDLTAYGALEAVEDLPVGKEAEVR